jgi:hypothetical protein
MRREQRIGQQRRRHKEYGYTLKEKVIGTGA